MKMSIKTALLLLATGLSTGVVMASALGQISVRTASMGGEVFFVPMVILLVWLGWMLRGEYLQIGKGKRSVKTKKQG